MKHTTTTVIISAVLAASMAAAVPALRAAWAGWRLSARRPAMSGMHGNPDAHVERMVRELNLDTKQRDAVRAISDKHRAEMRALHDRWVRTTSSCGLSPPRRAMPTKPSASPGRCSGQGHGGHDRVAHADPG